MPSLAHILQRPDVWRGDTLATAPLPGVPTGFAELDAELPGAGWPRSGLTEVLTARSGIGELALLLPMLAQLSAEELAWLIFVAPPHMLYAPALEAGGVALSRLLIVGAPGRDASWACERALDTDGVGAVVAWLPEARTVQLRRLQLAAEAGRTLLCVFRPANAAIQPSPAPLRLALDSEGSGLQVRILKRRGGALAKPITLAIPRPALYSTTLCSTSSYPTALRHALARPVSTASPARSAHHSA